MNIYDIAKIANVSTATVSRYINKSGYVGKKTASALEAIISKTGYSPSVAAKTLSTGNSFKLIGLVCYNIDDLYYAKSVSVLEKELKKSGYEMILSCTGKSIEEKEAAITMLISKSVDAIIFIGSVFMDGSGKIIKDAAQKVPCFIINAEISGNNIFSLYCDDRAAVRSVTTQLLESGCKKPLFLYDVQTYGSEQKKQGFLDTVKNGCCVNVPETFDEIIISLHKIYEKHLPDGIVCANDLIAAAVLSYLKTRNICVPHQVKVIGHNNSLLAKCSSPTLTSIDNRVEALSEATAQNIVKLFDGEKIQNKIKIDYIIKRRGSF